MNTVWTKKVIDRENEMPRRTPNEDEIKKVLWSIGPNKDLGPDRFNAFFYCNNWEKITEDVVQDIQWFMGGGNMV